MAEVEVSSPDQLFWDGYIDWHIHLREAEKPVRKASKHHVPVFLRLKQAGYEKFRENNDSDSVDPRHLMRILFDTNDVSRENDFKNLFQFESHELVFGSVEILPEPDTVAWPHEYCFFVYIDEAKLRHDTLLGKFIERFFHTLDVGIPVVLSKRLSERSVARPSSRSSGQLIGIVDDGIGFLNERFTRVAEGGVNAATIPGKRPLQTRFHALWIQARERPSPGLVSLGKELNFERINEYLSRTESEPELYAEINADVMEPDVRRATEFGFSHGTHVLDIAAGADPYARNSEIDKKMREIPILGVQLPSDAVSDTSGARFETYLVMGVRWILAMAERPLLAVARTSGVNKTESILRGPPAQVLINISMGVLAGPKNGTKFVEHQVCREVARRVNALGEGKIPDVRVTYAYGNNYRSNLVAALSVSPGGSQSAAGKAEIEWNVQPDDLTSSHIEIHRMNEDTIPSELQVGLETPDGSVIPPRSIPPGSYVALIQSGREIARIYHVPSRFLDEIAGQIIPTRGYYHVAIAPTASWTQNSVLAPAGRWKFSFGNVGSEAIELTLQVQRDDTAPGHVRLGRQSRLDHEHAYEWDDVTRDYTLPKGPISRKGTNSALTTVHPLVPEEIRKKIHFVGAVWRREEDREISPAHYTAQGDAWTGFTPTDSGVSETESGGHGIIANGTYSGSTQALSGTSAAAPQVVRRIALSSILGQPPIPQPTDGRITDPFYDVDGGRRVRKN
ncbi:hypothetical protein [Oricola cellulosilytica]|uniref:Peptidase S8/S53 domain-containing protein n=1 Tax=Oricola cellulosilytica TaxID=1429082 RepID=A0A4R0PIA8_9HYPH|nr:hypothetical protein [Oricola cellulosilytica]TCD15264.1 hypothetical protein E0D97_06930 [Oricola cellulosilytica]